jgi:hypothetical protein
MVIAPELPRSLASLARPCRINSRNTVWPETVITFDNGQASTYINSKNIYRTPPPQNNTPVFTVLYSFGTCIALYLANNSTTVGTLRQLKTKVAAIDQLYWTLLDKANKEAGGFISDGKGALYHCNYNGCEHQNHW